MFASLASTHSVSKANKSVPINFYAVHTASLNEKRVMIMIKASVTREVSSINPINFDTKARDTNTWVYEHTFESLMPLLLLGWLFIIVSSLLCFIKWSHHLIPFICITDPSKYLSFNHCCLPFCRKERKRERKEEQKEEPKVDKWSRLHVIWFNAKRRGNNNVMRGRGDSKLQQEIPVLLLLLVEAKKRRKERIEGE